MGTEELWTGESSGSGASFAAAARLAAEQWEEDRKKRGEWPPAEPVRLNVEEQYLLVGNPIHAYVVSLRPGGP
jgi:hypothetical protein